MTNTDQKKRSAKARYATTAIFLVQGTAIGAWAACIPAFRETLNLTDSALSLSLLAYAAGGLIGMPLAAWLVSRIGSHAATMSMGIFCSLSIIVPGLAPSLTFLVIAALIAGMGKGLVDIAMNTFAASIQTRWGSPIMSSFHAASSTGGLLGAVCVGLMFAMGYSIYTSLAVLTISTFVIVAAAAFFASGVNIETHAKKRAPAFALPTPALLGIGGLCFLILTIEGGVTDWSGVYMTTVVQVSTAQATVGFAAFSIMMVLGRLFGDRLVNRMGEKAVLLVGACAATVGFVFALGFASFIPTTLGFALVGLGVSNLVPILFTAAARNKSVPPATALAMTATVGYTGFLLGPPLIGFVSDLIGLRLALFGLLVSALFIAAVGPRCISAQDAPAKA